LLRFDLIDRLTADAQMSYLSKQGIVDFCVSEDSDLVPFGAKRMIHKLDLDGTCFELDMRSPNDWDVSQASRLDAAFILQFQSLTHKHVVDFCILSGCDYAESAPKVGIKTAMSLICRFPEPESFLNEICSNPRTCPSDPERFRHDFFRAREAFRNHMVLNPRDGLTLSLNGIQGPSDEVML